jgi:hypothetical protein
MTPSARWRALFVLLVFALLGMGPAQKKDKGGCPYCRNDPALLAAAGLVSHGPINIGPEGSEWILDRLPSSEWIFLESEHLRWASSLSSESVKTKDRERLTGELDRLRELFPDIPKKVKRLDPWLRIHLMAQRGEDFYARFQELIGVSDDDFPESRQVEGPYMGDGKYLGEKEKFEVLIHVNRETHRLFTSEFMGVSVTDSLRWHLQGQHKVIASIPAVDPDIRFDRFLHPHIVHNLAHNFLCAYKHYSYDPPVWLDEGLAHAMEQEINHEFHTLDGEEGSMPDNRGPGDWDKELARISKRGKRTSFAHLMRLKGFGAMSQDDHVSAYGLVRFMIDERPDEFAAFIGVIKGQLDERGYPDGSDLRGLQRAQLREIFGWTPAELDAAWGAWIEDREL